MAVHTAEATNAQRVAEAIAVVAEHAEETAELGRPADAAIAALDAGGLFRLSWPEVYGGAGASVAAQRDVVAAVAEVDGSVSWVTSVYNAVNGMIWIMDDRAHEEFFSSETPRSAGVFAPTGTFRRADGGFVLSGKWAFATGQHHAGWILVAAVPEAGGPPSGLLVPKSEFAVIDDWQVSGLVGTGSNSVSLTKTFVPDHREVAFGDIVAGESRSESLAHDTRIHQPFVPFMCAVSVGTPLGLARHALRLFGERIHGRGITYTIYKDQAAAPLTHLQLAEARMKLDQAEMLAERLIATVDAHAAGDPASWDVETRVRCRADIAWALRLCREACEIVEHGSGASAIRRLEPLAAILRDIRAISVHSFLLHSTNAELFGRVLAGLEPGIPFI